MNKLPLHKLTRVASSAAVSATSTNVYGVLLFGGSAATSLKLTNDGTGAGTAVVNFNTVANDTKFFDLSEVGPVRFDTACYATIAGTAGEAYIWWD